MFNIIVLKPLINRFGDFYLGFFLGGFFEEFDFFWVLLLFCLVGTFFFIMEDFLLYLKQTCHSLQIKNCLLLALPQRACGVEQQ